MKKIPTLYKKDQQNLALVVNEINPGCEWVFEKGVNATRKFDGTACAIIDGLLYKRYDVKKGRNVPDNAIPCQEPDAITGHWPHWVLINSHNPEDKYFCEALKNQAPLPDGTYELCGPKIQGNPEKFYNHVLVKHGSEDLHMVLWLKKPNGEYVYNFENFKNILLTEDIEGIVFHHPDGRMCKLRKSDFGIKR